MIPKVIYLGLIGLLLVGCVPPPQPSPYSSAYTTADDPMLKRAVVKLIREYKRLDARVQRHERALRSMDKSSKSIKKFVSEKPKHDYSVKVGVPRVNVRSKPSVSSRIYGTASRGESFVVIDKTDTNWYKIKHKGTTAWIHGSAITKEE